MAVEQRDLPRGWVWTTIGDICNVNPSKSELATLESDIDVTFVPMSAVDEFAGAITQPQQKRLSEVRKGFTYFADDDVIFAKITPSMENGKVAIASNLHNGLGFGSTEFHVLRPWLKGISDWVYHFVRQPSFRQQAKTSFVGTSGQLRVPSSFIESSPIPLAPLNEQRRIVAEIETLFTRIDAGVQSLRRAQAKLKRYRASVLQAAVEGRLVPTEAELAKAEGREYEPAGVLLERVREQRRQQFIEAQRQTLQAQIDVVASTNMSVTPMVLLTAWLQEMILLDVDVTQPALVNGLREDFFVTFMPELSRDEFRAQWATWHQQAVAQLQATAITSQVLMNPRDVTVSRTQISFSGMLGEFNAQSRLQTDSLGKLRQRWLIEPAEVKWREAEERLAKPDWANSPELPEGWAWTTVDALAETTGGVTKGRKLGGRATQIMPYLRVANVQRMFLDLSEVKEIEVPIDEIERHLLKNGDLVLIEGGDADKLGRSAIWRNQISGCIHQNHIFRARLSTNEIPTEWLMFYTNSTTGQQYFFKASKQTTNLASVNLSQLRQLPIAVPPVAEMRRIVAEVESDLSIAQDTEQVLTANLLRAERLRQSILRRAFAGELVAQDESDEPAPVLLERIRAERAAALSRPKLPRPKRVKDEQVMKAKERQPLYDVLKAAGKPLKPEDLLRQAGFGIRVKDTEEFVKDIETFYEELAREEKDKRIEIVRPNNADVLLRIKVDKQ